MSNNRKNNTSSITDTSVRTKIYKRYIIRRKKGSLVLITSSSGLTHTIKQNKKILFELGGFRCFVYVKSIIYKRSCNNREEFTLLKLYFVSQGK